MNICIFVGARPNFIKIAPIVRAIDKAKAEGKEIGSSLVYAGREDDPTLEPSLFDDSAPSRVAALLPPMPAVKSRSERPSMTRRLISFGIEMSNERVPATR